MVLWHSARQVGGARQEGRDGHGRRFKECCDNGHHASYPILCAEPIDPASPGGSNRQRLPKNSERPRICVERHLSCLTRTGPHVHHPRCRQSPILLHWRSQSNTTASQMLRSWRKLPKREALHFLHVTFGPAAETPAPVAYPELRTQRYPKLI
jgi:hypothetical protein